MRDLKIRPGMDTPKAKLKNPTPKDADSLLKQHMDKRQREKEPESRDPVRYATDRVEKNMRRGAAGAADTSRRMIKRYQEQKRQGKNSASESRTASETLETTNRVTPAGRNLPDTPQSHAARNEVGNRTISLQNCGGPKSADAAPQERGRQKAAQDAKAAYRRNLAEKRTAERHIVPPPSDRGGTMTTPQKGNSGVSAKGSPAPKSGQAITTATRIMRVRPTDHAVPNNAIITHRARGISLPYAKGKYRLEQARLSWKELTDETGVTTDDICRRIVDYGFQDYFTSHHPRIIPEPFTPEPVESYSKDDIDEFVDAYRQIAEEAYTTPQVVKEAPHHAALGSRIQEDGLTEWKKFATTWRTYIKMKKDS